MTFKKLLYYIMAIVIAATSLALPSETAEGAPRKKAGTSRVVNSKKSSSSKSSKRSSTGKKKSNRKSSKKRNSSKSKKKSSRGSGKKKIKRTPRPAPPKEVEQNDSLTLAVNKALLDWIPGNLNPGGLRVNSVKPDHVRRIANVSLNENYTYMPVTRELIDSISRHIEVSLPDSISNYRVSLSSGGKSMAYYITKVDKLPEKYRKNPDFVVRDKPLSKPSMGLPNDIVALWPSHGRYYRTDQGGWLWQRPMLFTVAEDTYTMGYIYPYVVPMLENAGAYVMLPRERDTNRHEVIVDNDTNDEGQIYSQPYYKEMSGLKKWTTGEFEGFIYDLPDFRDTENPFENGTYRETTTIRNGKPSVAAWYADIPEDGEYAVYVSYKSLPSSTTDARYTVNYSGGSADFKVNQTMGGSTWVYLGTFPFEKGYSDTEPVITLSNLTNNAEGTVITADAVKIGGGMGNIARSGRRADIYFDPSTPADSQEDTGDEQEDEEEEDDATAETSTENDIDGDGAQQDNSSQIAVQDKKTAPKFSTSKMPRFVEGARYWLHWAGFPEYIYSPYHGTNDYKDDYTSRGHWVNYLAGGSRVLPDREGLNIPVDLAFALHSDAGKRNDDSFIGTLGIYYTNNGDTYEDGTPRINSRMLTDLVMRQITNDIRQTYEPRWTRRAMWDKSYVEARVPEIPTVLIELMSHQNYADMMYGLDPEFRFTVGRAIYKGIARFLAERKGRELVIQPLPVKNFSIKKEKKNIYRLNWQPTPDPLESTAVPESYVIMERTEGDLGFHEIARTNSTHFEIRINDDKIHSFRVIATNKGGASFPSETLALCQGTSTEKPVLIINGFTRTSGPRHESSDSRAGFDARNDFGVPYIKDISFTGYQTEFNRNAGESAGRSDSNYATQVIAGNTFDYPALHGDAIAETGLGFVSTSIGAVENGNVKLSDYKIVDLILGKQKSTVVGNGKSGLRFRTFPKAIQKSLKSFVEKGGNLIVSGEYVASDLFDMRSDSEDRDFAENFLGITTGESEPTSNRGYIRTPDGRSLSYSSILNEKTYIVENPDILYPAKVGKSVLTLSFPDGKAAGLTTQHGNGRVSVMSIPFESILEQKDRDFLMKRVLGL